MFPKLLVQSMAIMMMIVERAKQTYAVCCHKKELSELYIPLAYFTVLTFLVMCFLRMLKFRSEESYIHQQIISNEEIHHKHANGKVLSNWIFIMILTIFLYKVCPEVALLV